jgi:DNA (cytosine-5)-methyltransferase 1
MARIIREARPRFAFVENSAALVTRGLGRVLGDLAEMGMDARWGVFSAGDVGARHERQRLFIVAHADKVVGPPRAWVEFQHGQFANVPPHDGNDACDCSTAWLEMACQCPRDDDELADRVDRTEAIGNGQVPAVAALAWTLLTGGS